MRRLLGFVRVLVVFASIGIFFIQMFIFRFIVRGRWVRVRYSNQFMRPYAAFACLLLKLKVNYIGAENLEGVRNGLFVSNHLSYMDVLAFSKKVGTCFITSTEIKRTPMLGLICQLAGCLFVERRNKLNIHNEVSELREGLQVGLNITIFPEATSTNGEQILRFRRPLFVSAIDAGRPVVPFCINYRKVGGKPINSITRDSIMWYGDMDFFPHLMDLASCGGVEVDIHFLPPIATTLETDAAELAERAQRAVESVFIPVPKA